MSSIEQILCVICFASFTTKASLKKHEDSIHKNITFGCPDCGKQFKRNDHLRNHINNVHKGIRYKCDQCDKKFTETSSRNIHDRAVHEQKKYPCLLCKYQATTQSHLTIHKKSVHEGVNVQYVDINQHHRAVFMDISKNMKKERNTSAIIVKVNINLLIKS